MATRQSILATLTAMLASPVAACSAQEQPSPAAASQPRGEQAEAATSDPAPNAKPGGDATPKVLEPQASSSSASIPASAAANGENSVARSESAATKAAGGASSTHTNHPAKDLVEVPAAGGEGAAQAKPKAEASCAPGGCAPGACGGAVKTEPGT